MDAISVGTEGILKPSSHGGASDSNDVKDASVNLRYLTLIYDRFKMLTLLMPTIHTRRLSTSLISLVR